MVSAVKRSKKGKSRGGKSFSREALYCLLSNPVYLGEIRHRQQSHPGQHEPIVGRELWERVQAQLRDHAMRDGEGRKTTAVRSPLAGKLFDEQGEPLYIQGAVKGQRRYRYYVSKRLVRGESQEPEQQWRLAAPVIERTVSAGARMMLGDRAAIALALEESDIDSSHLVSALKTAQALKEQLQADGETASSTLSGIIERVDLNRDGVRISLKLPIAEAGERNGTRHIALARSIPRQLKRRGVETRVVLAGEAAPSRADLPLLKAVGRARRWSLELITRQVHSVDEIARREQMDKRSVRRLLRLGFLSPRVIEAIAEGRQPPDLTVFSLMRRVDLPLLWSPQEHALGLR
jgi:site-specific DNA recombinase